jgi:hypothetical protein
MSKGRRVTARRRGGDGEGESGVKWEREEEK